MKYIYIPTGVGVDCDWKGLIVEICRGMVTIHSIGQTVFSVTYMEGITVGVSEAINGISGGAGDLSVDRIGEVDGRASEGHAAGMYGTAFTAGSLARIRTRDSTQGPGTNVGSDELTEVGKRD